MVVAFLCYNSAAEMIAEFIQGRVCPVVPTENSGDSEDTG